MEFLVGESDVRGERGACKWKRRYSHTEVGENSTAENVDRDLLRSEDVGQAGNQEVCTTSAENGETAPRFNGARWGLCSAAALLKSAAAAALGRVRVQGGTRLQPRPGQADLHEQEGDVEGDVAEMTEEKIVIAGLVARVVPSRLFSSIRRRIRMVRKSDLYLSFDESDVNCRRVELLHDFSNVHHGCHYPGRASPACSERLGLPGSLYIHQVPYCCAVLCHRALVHKRNVMSQLLGLIHVL